MARTQRNILWAGACSYGDLDHGKIVPVVSPPGISAADAYREIAQSGFDTIIVPFLGVAEDQSLRLRDIAVDDLPSQLPTFVSGMQTLKNSGKTLLISIGEGSRKAQTYFLNAARDLAAFNTNLGKFLGEYGFAGVDLNYENFSSPADAAFVAVANAIKDTRLNGNPDLLLSSSPVYDQCDAWTGPKGFLVRTAISLNGDAYANNFDWLNVQFYRGDYNIDPGDWPTEFDQWQSGIGDNATANGLTAPYAAFLVPGCTTFFAGIPSDCVPMPAGKAQYTPQVLADTISATSQGQIGGAFVWNYQSAVGLASAYSDAIAGALKPF